MHFQFNAYDLRRRATPCEKILWQHLRSRQMLGLKFRRQHPIGPYIVDFICLKSKIIIEVDGSSHQGREDYDALRDRWLRFQGYRVIRIRNEELLNTKIETLTKLRQALIHITGLFSKREGRARIF